MDRESYAINPAYLGQPRKVDIGEIKSRFKDAEISLELALDFDHTEGASIARKFGYDGNLFDNIIAEYNAGGSFYGIFDPRHSQETKEKLIERHKNPDEVGKNVFGVDFGINVSKIISDAKKAYSEGEAWRVAATIQMAETMVHEAAHSAFGADESGARAVGKMFMDWIKKSNRIERVVRALGLTEAEIIGIA